MPDEDPTIEEKASTSTKINFKEIKENSGRQRLLTLLQYIITQDNERMRNTLAANS